MQCLTRVDTSADIFLSDQLPLLCSTRSPYIVAMHPQMLYYRAVADPELQAMSAGPGFFHRIRRSSVCAVINNTTPCASCATHIDFPSPPSCLSPHRTVILTTPRGTQVSCPVNVTFERRAYHSLQTPVLCRPAGCNSMTQSNVIFLAFMTRDLYLFLL